jgi:hypothetical protein
MKSKLTKELEDKIIKCVEEKGYISIVSSMLDIPKITLYKWLSSNKVLYSRYIIARGKLIDKYKEAMIKASKNKKTEDWRMYRYLLITLDKEFSEMKWKDPTTDNVPKNVTFIFNNANDSKKLANDIIKDLPKNEYKQSDEIKLLDDNNDDNDDGDKNNDVDDKT